MQWGIHRELLDVPVERADDGLVRFYFPGALLGPRKPHKEVVEAFSAARGDNLRLIFKAQLERRMNYLNKAAEADPRIELVVDDMETPEHLRLFASCDVCLGPSRWEGLGLFLYEAAAFGMPQITNDSPPMNEVVRDGVNGILVGDSLDGSADSGIPSMKPDVGGADRRDRATRRPGRAGAARRGRRATPRGAELVADGRRLRRADPSAAIGRVAPRPGDEGPPRAHPQRSPATGAAAGRSGAAPTAPPPAPFVVGATRSGTTLLRLMLDAHPEIAIPSETHFIPDLIKAREKHGASPERMLEMLTSHRRWGDFHIEADELAERWAALPELTGPAAVREFFKLYGDKQGGPPRWGDKTPGYVKRMREIQEYLPEARFIHLIRDGRDVALSILKQSFGPETIEAAAERWRGRVLRGRAQQPYLGFYMEVKFEDLVLDTEGQLRRICEFIELDFDPAMLGYHETRRGAAQGEGPGAAARQGPRPAVGRAPAEEPREDLRAPEPLAGRRLQDEDGPGRPGGLRGARRRPAGRARLRGELARRPPTAPRCTSRAAARACPAPLAGRSTSPATRPGSGRRPSRATRPPSWSAPRARERRCCGRCSTPTRR